MLSTQENLKLYSFLTHLRSNNWLIDKHDLATIFKIIDWHEKVYGEADLKDVRDMELTLCKLTKQLTDYCKVISNTHKICRYCKEIKPNKEFEGIPTSKGKSTHERKTCLECRQYRKELELKNKLKQEIERQCTRCKTIHTSKFKNCNSCREFMKLYQAKRQR